MFTFNVTETTHQTRLAATNNFKDSDRRLITSTPYPRKFSAALQSLRASDVIVLVSDMEVHLTLRTFQDHAGLGHLEVNRDNKCYGQ